MSEIKGQLLGMILVFSVFAVIGAILVTAFKSSANNLASSFSEEGLITVANIIKTKFLIR